MRMSVMVFAKGEEVWVFDIGETLGLRLLKILEVGVPIGIGLYGGGFLGVTHHMNTLLHVSRSGERWKVMLSIREYHLLGIDTSPLHGVLHGRVDNNALTSLLGLASDLIVIGGCLLLGLG
jgi:hypothetical protein